MGTISQCTGSCLSRGCNCRPRATKRTISRIILERINRAPCSDLSPGELRAAVLEEHVRPVSASSINNAISYLAKKNEIRRVGHGKYCSIFILTVLKARKPVLDSSMVVLKFPNFCIPSDITT